MSKDWERAEDEYDRDKTGMECAQGIFYGACLSTVFWGVVLIIVMIWR